jgi:hypothetical protein
MEKTLILYPMFALVLWTFAVGAIQARYTKRAVLEGLHPNYFRHKLGYEPPGYLLSASQHFSNLFEMPVLFYAAVITIYTAEVNSIVLLALAWAYVVTRLVHSRQHLADKYLLKRRNAFFTSYFVLLAFWLTTIISVTFS